ncbi:MAG: hypothetical protein AAF311_04080, partial [Pseudomonadota bacterium]
SRYFDVDALAESLDYDLEAASAFVAQRIAYEPYIGVMRGPEGTLSTEGGSSWDQAVLLAALVNASGGEAMLGVGSLSEADARRLLDGAFAQRHAVSQPLEAMNWEAKVAERFDLPLSNLDLGDGVPNTPSLADYETTARQIASEMAVTLKASGLDFQAQDAQRTATHLQALAEEYVWVRFRDTPEDEWTDAHPAFGMAEAPQVEAAKFIASTVPQDRLHRIGVQFHIEVTQGENRTRKAVSSEFTRPAANLSATQLKLGVAPNLPFEEGRSTFFTPSINGVTADGGKSFDLMGNILSPEDAAAGPEIFRTVGNAFGSAMDGLASDEEGPIAPRLTGVLLTITSIAPGGERVEEVRRLTDFREGRPDDPAAAIAFDGVLEVDVGAENGVRNMKAVLDASAIYVRQLPYKLAFIAGDISGIDYSRHPAFDSSAKHTWLAALSSDAYFEHEVPEGIAVRSAPLVMMKRNLMSAAGSLAIVVDIQHNETLAFRKDADGHLQVSMEDALVHGIRDTLLEGELINVSGIPDWAQDVGGTVVTTSEGLAETPFWSQSGVAQQERLQGDLEHSGALLLPTGSERNWWRVDPQTGVVLGMSVLGGSEVSEEVTLLEILAEMFAGYVFANGIIGGTQHCAGAGSGAFEFCCLTGMTLSNIGVGLVGGGLANYVTNSFSATYALISGITFDVATGVVPVAGDLINDGAATICGAAFER